MPGWPVMKTTRLTGLARSSSSSSRPLPSGSIKSSSKTSGTMPPSSRRALSRCSALSTVWPCNCSISFAAATKSGSSSTSKTLAMNTPTRIGCVVVPVAPAALIDTRAWAHSTSLSPRDEDRTLSPFNDVPRLALPQRKIIAAARALCDVEGSAVTNRASVNVWQRWSDDGDYKRDQMVARYIYSTVDIRSAACTS